MFACNLCGRNFSREQNLEWHLRAKSHLDQTNDVEKITVTQEDNQMTNNDSYCPSCHSLEREVDKTGAKLEKAETKVAQLNSKLRKIEREPPAAQGHTTVNDLLGCPSHAPGALEGFDGMVIPPGQLTSETVDALKRMITVLGEGIELP